MFRFGDNNLQSSKQTSTAAKRSETGYVIEVILDDTNDSLPIFKTVGENASDVHTGKVGGVKVRLLSSQEANDDSLPIIYPLDDTIRTLPLLGEEVQIHSIGGKKYYTRLLTEGFPNIQNSGIGEYQDSFGEGDTAKGSSTDYSSNQATGISQPQGGPSSNKGDYGDYFKADEKIHKLKLYEGDTILESRFGQSIRFSGYNNDDNTFSPTIIIRNRESDPSREAQCEFQSQKIGGLTEEDINRDGSTIAMGSRDKQFDFVPGVVDDKGNSDFETKSNMQTSSYPQDGPKIQPTKHVHSK